MKRLVICVLVVLSFAALHSGAACGAASDPVARIVDTFYKKNGLTGLSVSVSRNGRTSDYHRGYANLESRDKVTGDSVFRIASVSKLFTTLATLKLAEQGRLSLDDPLVKYVPAFPYGDTITLKNLLHHTSGIPNFAEFPEFAQNQAKEWKPTELVDLLKTHLGTRPLDFEPGTKAAYSNSNFMLLGLVVEAASGTPFDDFVSRYVTTPLAMKHTGVGSDTALVPHRAAGYNVGGGKITNAAFVSVVAPFGTGDFMSQPRDLVKVSRAFKPGVLLSRVMIDEMARPVVLKDGTPWIGHNDTADYSFGYCWELVRPKGGTEWICTKGGAISGFFAHVVYFRKSDVTIAISANAQGNFSLLALGLEIGRALHAMN